MARFCANCGTEVDESAIFCPTCGQPIDEAIETEMPPAPAWPEPTNTARVEEPIADAGPTRFEPEQPTAPDAGWGAPPPIEDAPTRTEPRLEPPPAVAAPPPMRATPPRTASTDARSANQGPPMNVPVTMPVTPYVGGAASATAASGSPPSASPASGSSSPPASGVSLESLTPPHPAPASTAITSQSIFIPNLR